jgi:FkbM family methyltransferase
MKQLAFLFRRMARRAAEDPVDVVQWGHRLRLHARGNFSEATFLFMPRRWDWRERALLERELSPGAVLVDVGANAGGYIWWTLHLLGRDCRILALEPEPRLHERLLFNLQTNGVGNVRVERVAVGTAAGEGWLQLAAHNMGESVLLGGGGVGAAAPAEPGATHGDGVGEAAPVEPGATHGDANAGVIRVPVRPLPELVTEAGLERVDALKVDVEGLEAAILSDYFDRAPEPLWPRLLLIERNDGPAHRALMTRLTELRYAEAVSSPLNIVLVRTAM